MRIAASKCNFEREPLMAPFGFKGGSLSELWQSVVLLGNDAGHEGVGLGVQSTLWSDPSVFAAHSEPDGNGLMYRMTAHACEQARHLAWQTPIDLLDQLLPLTHEYGKKIAENPRLRLTFALNALVPLDSAAWLLYCQANGIKSFDGLIPAALRPAFPSRHASLGAVPLLTYGVTRDQIGQILDEGYFILKIKIGSDPRRDGDRDAMLEWDQRRLKEIHDLAGRYSTPYTDSGFIAYYLDANGRYDRERLLRFMDYARKIGALERIVLLEEPFAEECREDVSGLPVRVAADESAHSVEDSIERINLGYKAIALKPIAKTMSMSLRIAKAASDRGTACFCADLTVNPAMVEWNKNVAARLAPLPGVKTGILESNGPQNYRNWERMKTYHPCNGAGWTNIERGLFELDDDFYRRSGGIFSVHDHYLRLVSL